MRGRLHLASLAGLAACVVACTPDAKPRPKSPAPGDSPSEVEAAPPPSSAPAPASAGAMPPATPKKAGCLDSSRGALHTFVGKLEKHPDGSGNFRVHLPKKVCFSGGRFSAGETDDVVLDIEESKATPLLARKVKVVGKSQDFAPAKKFAYVMRLEVVSLAVTK